MIRPTSTPTRSTVSSIAERGLLLALAAVSALAFASFALVAAAHLGDDRSVDNHAAGVWIQLARYANNGTLDPPLYDGQAFGGTRYSPLPILLDHYRVVRKVGHRWLYRPRT